MNRYYVESSKSLTERGAWVCHPEFGRECFFPERPNRDGWATWKAACAYCDLLNAETEKALSEIKSELEATSNG